MALQGAGCPETQTFAVTGCASSKAPMSQPAPCGRATPRWSAMTRFPNASVQAFTGMASIAVAGEQRDGLGGAAVIRQGETYQGFFVL
ncbi:MAG TPA: hypothetical protein VMR62_37280 [Bryobacteraceae bacterium]|jgi:hypothetical protein|nr:hypothetical protein [Bryobacteraceae bacterium]